MTIHRSRLALALSLLGGLTWSGSALAAGFSTARFGGEHGNPIASNPTAIYYNPAGIADSEGIHLFLDGSLALRAASYTHDAVDTDDNDVPGANVGEATLFNLAAAPMLGASAKFGDLAVGAGVYVPFGGAAVWDTNDALESNKQHAGPVDGVQRWHSIDGSLTELYATLAVAYKIPSIRLSVGVSGNLILSSLNTVRARALNGTNTLGLEGRSLLEVSGVQGAFGVGALYEVLPKMLWVGASYQSRPNVAGGMKLEGTLRNYLYSPNPAVDPITTYDVDLHQDFPDIVRLGVRYAPSPQLEVRLFGDWTRWSAMQNQCLSARGKKCEIDEETGAQPDDAADPNGEVDVIQNIVRRWNDSAGVRAGVSYWATPQAELFGGLGYDSNAIPDSTLDPSATDFHDVSLSVGGRFELLKQLHVAASYTHIFYVGRDTGAAANDGESASITDTLNPPSKTPDSGGAYSQTVGVFNVNVDVAF